MSEVPGLRTFLQLFKFGVSGILGVAVSTGLFFTLQDKLPSYWAYGLDLVGVAYYVATSCIGGTIHFVLSKVWVFEK